jgi:hypothetical protein
VLVRTKNLAQDARGLTQANYIGLPVVEAIAGASSETRSVNFTRALMASVTSDVLFTIGLGDLDTKKYVKILIQAARQQNIPFFRVKEEMTQFIKEVLTDSSSWRKLLIPVIGDRNRPIKERDLTKTTFLMVNKAINDLAKRYPYYIAVIGADIVFGVLSNLGWTVPDAPITFRLGRGNAFPNLQDFIDLVEGYNLEKAFDLVKTVDASAIVKSLEQGSSLDPISLPLRFADSMNRVSDRIREAYNPSHVVESILTLLGRFWAPDTPEHILTPRILRMNGFAELESNLTLFTIYQEMISINGVRNVHFSDDELPIVLAVFREAIESLSSYKVRTLDEVAGCYGKRSSHDYKGRRVHSSIYESWNFSEGIQTFTSIKHSRNMNGSYLLGDPHTTKSMTACLQAAQKVFSIDQLVDLTIRTRDSIEPEIPVGQQVPTSTFELVIPSSQYDIAMTEVIHPDNFNINNQPSAAEVLRRVITTGGSADVGSAKDDDEDASVQVINKGTLAIHRHSRDLYVKIAHYVVSKMQTLGRVSVGYCTNEVCVNRSSEGCPALVLVFDVTTKDPYPYGSTIPFHDLVRTTEPCEALAYLPDHNPVITLESRSLDVEAYKDSLHSWDFETFSAPLRKSFSYKITVKGKSLGAKIHEHQVLATGEIPGQTRYMLPFMTKAMASLWLDTHQDAIDFLNNQLTKLKAEPDPDRKLALEARRNNIVLNQALAIIDLAQTGVGSRFINMAMTLIGGKLSSVNDIVIYRSMERGAQRSRLVLWAGLSVLTLTGILSKQDQLKVLQNIKSYNAFDNIISSIDNLKGKF